MTKEENQNKEKGFKLKVIFFILLVAGFLSFAIIGSEQMIRKDGNPIPKTIHSSTTLEVIDLDGALKESSWKECEAVTDFVVIVPYTKKASREPSSVKFIEKEDGLYVGIECEAAKTSTKEGAEDQIALMINLSESSQLDAIFSLRTTPSNKIDRIKERTTAYEAVTLPHEKGWTAELFISKEQNPQLFQSGNLWHINIARIHRHLQEYSSWYDASYHLVTGNRLQLKGNYGPL